MSELLMWAGGIIITGIFGLIKRELNMVAKKFDEHKQTQDNLAATDKELDKKIDEHRLYTAVNYTTRTDIKEMKDDLVKILNRIDDKLDKKQDKP